MKRATGRLQWCQSKESLQKLLNHALSKEALYMQIVFQQSCQEKKKHLVLFPISNGQVTVDRSLSRKDKNTVRTGPVSCSTRERLETIPATAISSVIPSQPHGLSAWERTMLKMLNVQHPERKQLSQDSVLLGVAPQHTWEELVGYLLHVSTRSGPRGSVSNRAAISVFSEFAIYCGWITPTTRTNE